MRVISSFHELLDRVWLGSAGTTATTVVFRRIPMKMVRKVDGIVNVLLPFTGNCYIAHEGQ
jgi:hypothetical protein